MARSEVQRLFGEYRDAWRRGEHPDAAEYLDRAGEEAETLAVFLDAFLTRAQPPAPSEEARLVIDAIASGESPLLELRRRRGIGRDAVVDLIVERFGIAGLREKAKRRYHELESGLLDTEGLDTRLIDALSEILRARAAELVHWRPPPLAPPAAAYYRAESASPAAMPQCRGEVEEPDEVDRLFGVG